MSKDYIKIKIPFNNQLKEQFSDEEDIEKFKQALLEYMVKGGLVITNCPVLFYSGVNKISFEAFGKIKEIYFNENYAVVSTTPELAQLAKDKNARIALNYYQCRPRITSCVLVETNKKQETYYEKL